MGALSPALAQQPQIGEQVRQTCRSAALNFCNPGSPPDRVAFRRCAAENKSKLPPECAVLFDQSGPSSR